MSEEVAFKTKEDVVRQLRRDCYGSYSTKDLLFERLEAFIEAYKEDLPQDFNTSPIIWNHGVTNRWLQRTQYEDSDGGQVHYTIIEDLSISELRRQKTAQGVYPLDLLHQKENANLQSQIEALKEQVAVSRATNMEYEEELNALKGQVSLRNAMPLNSNDWVVVQLHSEIAGLKTQKQQLEDAVQQLTVENNKLDHIGSNISPMESSPSSETAHDSLVALCENIGSIVDELAKARDYVCDLHSELTPNAVSGWNDYNWVRDAFDFVHQIIISDYGKLRGIPGTSDKALNALGDRMSFITKENIRVRASIQEALKKSKTGIYSENIVNAVTGEKTRVSMGVVWDNRVVENDQKVLGELVDYVKKSTVTPRELTILKEVPDYMRKQIPLNKVLDEEESKGPFFVGHPKNNSDVYTFKEVFEDDPAGMNE